MQRARSQVVRHAFDFKAGFHSLQLDQQHFLDQQVYKLLTKHRAIIGGCDPALLHDSEASLAQLMRQRIFVDLPPEIPLPAY